MAGRDHRGGRCLRRRDLSGGIFREKRQVKKHKEQTHREALPAIRQRLARAAVGRPQRAKLRYGFGHSALHIGVHLTDGRGHRGQRDAPTIRLVGSRPPDPTDRPSSSQLSELHRSELRRRGATRSGTPVQHHRGDRTTRIPE